jgi:predicted transcriptional regulator
MSVAITVHFPDPVYQRLQQQASVLERPVDDIIRQTVEQGLPLWLDSIPPNFERQLAQLDKVSLSQLKKIYVSPALPATGPKVLILTPVILYLNRLFPSSIQIRKTGLNIFAGLKAVQK